MDSYLESLTKKSEEAAVEQETVEVAEEIPEVIEKPEVETTEEVTEPIDEIAEEIVEEGIEAASSVDPEEYTEVVEEVEAELEAEEAEPVKEEKIIPIPEVKPEPKQVPKSAIKNNKYCVGDIINVRDIKIYGAPAVAYPYRSYTGNVVYKGQSGEFSAIEYMYPGFGIVKGFTNEI